MSDFRRLSDTVYASPQVTAADIAEAASLGIKLVINNRPEGEAEDQTPGSAIEAAARAAGMDYAAIPVTMPTLSDVHVLAMEEKLANAEGPVLAYCRSGTRSTLLWSLAQAKSGGDPDEIAAAAAAAGYDVSPVRAAMDAYAAARE
ncbi:MAG TPA: TIGR01244 family sulfur transferase [Sphingomonadaceae bacterium]|nr:TIGR01244 family sulfur transferase [Sphingomonadaceae bacterium]